MRIGLMGGTFNPPHNGHKAVAETVLNFLELDAVWWLVTPRNPLKKDHNIPDLSTRYEICRDFVDNPKLVVSDIEGKIGSYSTYDSVTNFRYYFQDTDFIWIAGYDNALNFHEWENWQTLVDLVPFCFVARPPAVSLTENCHLRVDSGILHRPLHRGGKWPLTSGVCYYIMQMHMIYISSTQLRNDINDQKNIDF